MLPGYGGDVAIKSKFSKYYSEWAKLYVTGLTTYEIAEKCHCSRSVVSDAIKKLGLTRSTTEVQELMRTTGKYNKSPFARYHEEWCSMYSEGMSVPEIASKYSCGSTTVSKIIRKNEISRTPKEATALRNLKRAESDPRSEYHYFDVIDSEEKAYWLGMLLADGSVSYKKGAYSVIFKLKEEDGYMVDRLADIFGATRKDVSSICMGKRFWGRVCFLNSKYLCTRLISLGIKPQKSGDGGGNTFNHISTDLMPHFLRGLFDGDGSIYIRKDGKRCVISIYGSLNIVVRTKLELMKPGVANNMIVPNTGIYMTAWAKHSDLKKIMHYLYDESTIHLHRKYKVVQEIFSIIGDIA